MINATFQNTPPISSLALPIKALAIDVNMRWKYIINEAADTVNSSPFHPPSHRDATAAITAMTMSTVLTPRSTSAVGVALVTAITFLLSVSDMS